MTICKPTELRKSRKMTVGTVSTRKDGSKWKKIRPGYWAPVKGDNKKKAPSVKERIDEEGDKILTYTSNKHERAMILDSEGNRVLSKDGGKTDVFFTAEEADKMPGTHMIHNHPGEPPVTLSPADVALAISLGVESSTVVTSSTRYSYSGFGKLTKKLHAHFLHELQRVNTEADMSNPKTVQEVRRRTAEWVYNELLGNCLDDVRDYYDKISTGDREDDKKLWDTPEVRVKAQDLRMAEFARKYGGNYEKS